MADDCNQEILDHLLYIRAALDRLVLTAEEIIADVSDINLRLDAAMKNIEAQMSLLHIDRCP